MFVENFDDSAVKFIESEGKIRKVTELTTQVLIDKVKSLQICKKEKEEIVAGWAAR